MAPALAKRVPVRTDGRVVLAGLAFLLLLARHAGALVRRLRTALSARP